MMIKMESNPFTEVKCGIMKQDRRQNWVLVKDLTKREAEVNKNSSERIKFVEKGGLKVKDILIAKNPLKKTKCSQTKCPLCAPSQFVTPGENLYPCNTHNVGYRWHCLLCREGDKVKVYEGESSRSARVRGTEHLRDLENKRNKSVLYKHILSEHNGQEVKFQMEITGRFKDALSRQANEAVRIYSRPGDELLNIKSEFNHQGGVGETS